MKKKLAAVLMASAMIMGTVNVHANALISESLVNVRTGNDTSFDIMGQLPYGYDVDVISWDVGNGWALAQTPYGTGYIRNDLLTYMDRVATACEVANQYKSWTDYQIVVDTGLVPRVYVFAAGNGWELSRILECSVGAPESPTPTGVYMISYQRDILHSPGTDEYYVSDFAYDAAGAWCFHSTLFEPGTFNPVDDRTGMHISNGCVRLHLADAEWLWSTCGIGTRVVII